MLAGPFSNAILPPAPNFYLAGLLSPTEFLRPPYQLYAFPDLNSRISSSSLKPVASFSPIGPVTGDPRRSGQIQGIPE